MREQGSCTRKQGAALSPAFAASRARYRIRQFVRSVRARPEPAGLALARSYLSPDEFALFCATAPRDQWHHIRTLELLPPRYRTDREVARAALLHDAGKGYIHLHERVIYVLFAAVAPRLLQWCTRREGRGTLGALYRIRHHGCIAVALLQPLGTSARELTLIARHHDPDKADPALVALVDADDRA